MDIIFHLNDLLKVLPPPTVYRLSNEHRKEGFKPAPQKGATAEFEAEHITKTKPECKPELAIF